MRLYIAEKPSMATEIMKCLFPTAKKYNGYFSDGTTYITWAYGHILQQAEPENYNPQYKYWNILDLPIIPQEWQMLITPSSAKQFHIIKGLISQTNDIVHAGDPDREGQLLIDEIIDYLHCTKPVYRILLNALDKDSIIQANNNLRANTEFFHLKQSALARARADWLIGMNLSRAYTLAARRSGRKGVLPVGRVKTPTLALIVRRERELENFKPINYFPIKAQFQYQDTVFCATWKPRDTQPGLDPDNRLIDKTIADQLVQRFNECTTPGIITAYKKQLKKEYQRLPFSLSSLQVLAGKKYGMDPQTVLDTAQSLYEKKLTTYPRSDCEYLPVNQWSDASTILRNLQSSGDGDLATWASLANPKEKSKAWNDSKITAHHAIIPTKIVAKLDTLTTMEQQLYYLIAQAYIAQFYPIHTYYQTQINIEYADENFATSGRVVKELGWKQLYMKLEQTDEDTDEDTSTENNSLPEMKKGDTIHYQQATAESKFTKPPQRFTSSTLLLAMKEIHKYVKNSDLKKQLKEVYGIGTEATRAGIIEDLEKRGFVTTMGKKKYLQPTTSAYLLIDALPDDMTYPDSTAIWEDYLQQLSTGQGSIEEFLRLQTEFATKLCEKASSTIMTADSTTSKQVLCPRCQKGILVARQGKNGAFWGCSNFPHCRMTCNDVDGKPQLPYSSTGSTSAPIHGLASMENDFISAQALIASTKKYSSTSSIKPKSKYSAKPLEQAPTSKTPSPYTCPHCKTGNLTRRRGRNGYFWGCSNYPHCTSTYDDIDNKPVL